MNQRHPLDELFNQHLHNASAPVPEDMFSRIAKARQQKRRRLIVIWSSLGSASLVIVAAAIWMFTGGPDLGSFPLSIPNTVDGTPNTIQETSTATPQTADVITTTVETFPNSAALASNTPTAVSTANSSPSRKTTKAATSASLSSQSYNSLAAPSQAVDMVAIPATTSTDPIETLTPTAEVDATADEQSSAARIAGPHQRQSLGVVNMLPERDFHLAKQAEIKLFANHAPRCADFAAPYFRLDLEMLGGPAYAHQTLKAKTSESLPHLRQRQSSESASVSFSGGFRLAASSNVGLGLRTGLMYTEINDRFTFNVGSRMDVSVIFGPNGEIIDRDTVYTAGYEDTRRNKLRFVEIPLLLGYERQWGKFRVGVNAGAFLNLYFGANGAVYSPATAEPIDFGQQGDRDVLPIFERQATAAWYAGVSLAYNLHSRYSIIAEPYFKTYPQALSSGAYDLQQNYWLTGMQLGMRMRL